MVVITIGVVNCHIITGDVVYIYAVTGGKAERENGHVFMACNQNEWQDMRFIMKKWPFAAVL